MPSSEKAKKHSKKKAAVAGTFADGGNLQQQLAGQAIGAAARPAKPVADEVIREVRDNAVAKLRSATKAQNGKADEALNWLHFVSVIERQYDFSEPEATEE
jgi:hypothetical protein